MPRKLVDLEISEVSAVTKPANKRRFLIIKSAEGTMSAWDEIQKRSAESGQSVAEICQRSPDLYNRHAREMRRGQVEVPEVRREAPVMKSSSASDTMLTFAKHKLFTGEAKTMKEAIELVHQEHKDLYATHVALSREGK